MEQKGIWLATCLRESENIRRHWGWFFLLGIMLTLLGMVLIGSAYTATLFSILLLGSILIGASVVHIVQAILGRKWSGLFLTLLLAILYGVTGVLCITHPAAAALDITLLIAVLCFVGGLFKMLSSLIMQFERWGWVFFNGLITFILGMLIYSQWPSSGLWVIGTFVGIDMLFSGWAWMMLALIARKN